ncbi:MAG: DUF1835 domain-containing protein [Bacteroidota bacterium]
MMHIVFNEVELNLFQEVMALEPELQGEIRLIRDDYAVGPIAAIETEEGQTNRRAWWQQILADSTYSADMVAAVDDLATVSDIEAWLQTNPEEELWIWMGQNQHDVMGYYWLISQLKDFSGRVQVLYMNNLPFINDKGQLFYPSWLSEIPAKEFRKAKKLARPVTLSEFEIDPDEFNRLKQEGSFVRILEGGKKIIGHPIDYFDKEILRQCPGDFQKGARVLQQLQQRMKVRTGDVFLMHRLRELLRQGVLQSTGAIDRAWKDLDLKLAGSSVASATVEGESTTETV